MAHDSLGPPRPARNGVHTRRRALVGAVRAAAVVLVLAASLAPAAGCGGADGAGGTGGAAGAAGSGGGGGGGEGAARLLVVTSVPVIYSLTANVAGDAVRLENLLPPGSSPHQVTFTPSQARLISDADVLIINGANLEPWVDDLVASAGNSDLQVVVASDGVEFLRPDEALPLPSSGSGEQTSPGDVDPHVWLDVSNARLMVGNIAEALCRVDPAGAADYRRRAATYTATLDALDSEVRAALAPLSNRRFVSFHSAFQYYARAYGLEQVAVIEEFPGKEPSPQYLAGLVRLIGELKVPAVFSEPQFSARPAEALARETGVSIYEVDPEGAAISPTMYEDLIRKDTEVFVTALGGAQ
ncbi:MAG TPA: metal ABC transporter substrate-binding protein [Thermoleophilia bacterium]|nr:metal ABC transporter substrate-binding protein [Thermoleophilia bacterium]